MSKRKDFTTEGTKGTEAPNWWRERAANLFYAAVLFAVVWLANHHGAQTGAEKVLRAIDAAMDSCGGRA